MLQQIREKVSGWIAYGIIFLISVPFALFGVNSYFGGGEIPPAASINGEEITLRSFDQAYANYRQRLSRLFGGSIPESFGSEAALREQVLNQMVEEISLRQYTEDKLYRISDDELSRIIRASEEFHSNGQFDAEVYQAQLRSVGASPLAYEQQLRINQGMNQFQSGITATAFTVPVIADQFSKLSNQSRKVRSLSYSVDPASIEVSDEEIEKRYRDFPDRFRTPEQIRIDYIEVSLDNLKQSISVDQADVLSRYQENQQIYTTPEVREASHILITVTDDEQSGQALQQIREIRERIIAGESFADLAREFSEDPGSAADGGNLGEVERGIMVEAFESALFSMQPEQISDPVKTTFGWHLIQLHGISGGETRPFDSVKDELEDEIRTELAEGQIYDLVENLANLVYEQPDSLVPAAEQLGLEINTSDWFGRASDNGIAAEAAVRQAAFSAEVFQQGLNSEAIELGSDRILFIRLNEVMSPELQPLDVVRDQIRSELLNSKLLERNMATGSAALEALQGGKSLDEIAQEWESSINDLGFISRDQADIDNQIKSIAFRLPKPDQSVIYEGFSQGGGEYTIIELSAVISNDAAVDAEQIQNLTNARAAAEYRSALKLISNRSEVVRTPLEDLEYPNQPY